MIATEGHYVKITEGTYQTYLDPLCDSFVWSLKFFVRIVVNGGKIALIKRTYYKQRFETSLNKCHGQNASASKTISNELYKLNVSYLSTA